MAKEGKWNERNIKKIRKWRMRKKVFQERRKRKTRQQSQVWTSRRGHDVPGILSNVALFRRGFTVQLTFRQLLLQVWRFIGSRSSFISSAIALFFSCNHLIYGSPLNLLHVVLFFFSIFYPQHRILWITKSFILVLTIFFLVIIDS